ncbi:MAG TPA: type IV pilus assembly protein PilM [Candidatus Saccharimonadales bacterium]|nr:type IV pilus assembly protein PilM [Candidatus Saccharimonadales bacterium]
MNSASFFYQDKPIFGLDIGFSSIKLMQVDWLKKQPMVSGYGTATFNPLIVKNGVIVDIESMSKTINQLFKTRLTGEITSRRVALTIPASRAFNRPIKLPAKLTKKELDEAAKLEAERYIPLPLNQLYLDYIISGQTEKEIDLFIVAASRQIVDSYITLCKLLNLDIVAIETTIAAAARLLVEADRSDVPTILIDFGSRSVDITIFDKKLIVTGTVGGGSDDFTARIAEKLNTTQQQAYDIKTNFGIDPGKHQKEITEALTPILQQLLKEVRRVIRYYEERFSADRKIGQIVTMGGGANMPGLSEYMTDMLRLPVRMSDPWGYISFANLQPPNIVEKSMYGTVAGSSLLNPSEAFE